MQLSGIDTYILAAKPPPAFLVRAGFSFGVKGEHALGANHEL